MSDSNNEIVNAIDPKRFPEQAANQVILALIAAGNLGPVGGVNTPLKRATEIAELHKTLTSYYQSLKK